MTDTNMQILEALETLAEAFPWDKAEIDIHRLPEGTYRFYAVLPDTEKYGFEFACASGDSAAEAVAHVIESQAGKRDPNTQRTRKISELQVTIAKLQAVVIGLPPYKPNRELARINLPAVPATIDL